MQPAHHRGAQIVKGPLLRAFDLEERRREVTPADIEIGIADKPGKATQRLDSRLAREETRCRNAQVIGAARRERTPRRDQGLEALARRRPEGDQLDQFGGSGNAAVPRVRIDLAVNRDRVALARAKLREPVVERPLRPLDPPPRRAGPQRRALQLELHHAIERREDGLEALVVALERGEDVDHRLDRGHAVLGGLLADAVAARLPRHEADARQPLQRRIQPHELARLRPGAVDDDERPGRRLQRGGVLRVGSREEERCPRLGEEGLHARIVLEIYADVHLGVGQRLVRDPRRADGAVLLARVLEEAHARAALGRPRPAAPAGCLRAQAAIAAGARALGGRCGKAGHRHALHRRPQQRQAFTRTCPTADPRWPCGWPREALRAGRACPRDRR